MKVRYQFRRRCPTCGSREVSRSRRKGWLEWIMPPLLVLRPFRCYTCMRRYWGFWLARYALEPEHVLASPTWAERQPYHCVSATSGHEQTARLSL